MKKLVMFDLDGTLLNTIADLAHSTNYALNKLGYPTHEIEKYNFMVGNGIDKLFERALPEEEKSKENVLRVRKEFVPYYDIHQAATQKLVDHYFPEIHFTAVLGQREEVKVKPDPIIVSDILEVAKVAKEEVLYVGDSGVDMQTAANAGVTACGVTWGFRPRTELEEFNPSYIADTAGEIKKLIL